MLVSATGGEGSSPPKNHKKIGSLRKLTCERLLEWQPVICQFQVIKFFPPEIEAMWPVSCERKLPIDKAAKVGV